MSLHIFKFGGVALEFLLRVCLYGHTDLLRNSMAMSSSCSASSSVRKMDWGLSSLELLGVEDPEISLCFAIFGVFFRIVLSIIVSCLEGPAWSTGSKVSDHTGTLLFLHRIGQEYSKTFNMSISNTLGYTNSTNPTNRVPFHRPYAYDINNQFRMSKISPNSPDEASCNSKPFIYKLPLLPLKPESTFLVYVSGTLRALGRDGTNIHRTRSYDSSTRTDGR